MAAKRPSPAELDRLDAHHEEVRRILRALRRVCLCGEWE